MSAKPTSGLNVYKKVAIIRKADDVLSFEDADGSVKAITDLHLAAASTVGLQLGWLDYLFVLFAYLLTLTHFKTLFRLL